MFFKKLKEELKEELKDYLREKLVIFAEKDQLREYYDKLLSRKEQECKDLKEDIKDIANLLDLDTGEEYNFGNIEIAIKDLKHKGERLKKYLNQIRDEELSHLDIEWDEYETSARKEDYSNIITLVERALGEIDD